MEKVIDANAIIVVFNEASRIYYVLSSLKNKFKYITVFDKGSTDNTESIVSDFEGVKFKSIPFSPRGREDYNLIIEQCSSDWVFLLTASDVYSDGFHLDLFDFEKIKKDYSLVYIPRKMYSLGDHVEKSPLGVCYYPFYFNRKTIEVTNKLHEHFRVRENYKEYYFKYKPDACIHHFTHSNAKQFLLNMVDYFEAEVEDLEYDDIDSVYINRIYKQYSMYERTLKQGGSSSLGQYCAWTIYWHGVILFAWEKRRKLKSSNVNLALMKDCVDNNGLLNDSESYEVVPGFSFRGRISQWFINVSTRVYRWSKRNM